MTRRPASDAWGRYPDQLPGGLYREGSRLVPFDLGVLRGRPVTEWSTDGPDPEPEREQFECPVCGNGYECKWQLTSHRTANKESNKCHSSHN